MINFSQSRGKMYHFGKYSFSSVEIVHLSVALVMITLTLMALDFESAREIGILNFILIYFTTVGLGFLLHELGHKFVAQYYGKTSEFRADFTMLVFAFIMAWFLGFVFIAPGAVMIFGNLSRSQNGKVSIAGPLINLVLAGVFAILGFIINPGENSVLGTLFFVGVLVNSFLGIFNLLPFWVLDGKKVFRWNKGVYFSVMSGLVFLLIGSFSGWFF